YDQDLVGRTWLAGHAEYEMAVGAALAIRHRLLSQPAHERSAILMNLVELMKTDREVLARLIALEAAKPVRYAFGEVDRAIQTFFVAAEEARRIGGEYLGLDWTPAGNRKEGLVKWFPAGVVGGIAPFNFPLNLASHKLGPAIASGCPVILKPSTRTPLSVLHLARLMHDAGVPEGAVSILPMDRRTGDLLVTDYRLAVLSFTGSPAVGWDMKARAGRKKVVLELGGNAGVIVDETADPDMAAIKCLSGAFAYSGQVCIHTQRIFVHRSIFRQFTEVLVNETAGLKQGNPMDIQTDISAMIDEANAIRVEDWIGEAVGGGARILAGGKRKGSYMEPTILTGTRQDMKVCGLEVFGPVVCVEPYDGFDEAVRLVNNGRYGLQAGVFTDSLAVMNQAFEQLEVGGVIINDVPTFRVDHMPYGGVKESGSGREGVRYAMQDMMEPRLLVKPF
ncbi:MAG: aldehyde dehydrogenase, partial [Bacteroidetes bacterium HGW-Bacteroidetes-22]